MSADADVRSRSRRRRRRMPSLVQRALVTAASFTVLLLVGSLGVAGLTYQHYDSQITRVAVLKPSDASIIHPEAQVDAQNFLLIGSDTRAGADASYGQDVEGARSDTTILVHLAHNLDHVTVVSFPRDSWVPIPACADSTGHVVPAHEEMFNSAFSEGGAGCTVSLVQQLTGIEITHYVQVDFVGFKSMVDALGTVSICSPQAVNDPGSGLRLQPGMNALNGDQALAYVRARETIGDGSDLGRIKRQQLFLGAVLRQAMSGHLLSDPARLTSFLDAATRSVTLDKGTTLGDVRTLASVMQGLDPARVTFYTAPIANPDYTPPGTDMTGRVLLDANAGRVLYDSIIADAPVSPPAAAPAVPAVSGPSGGPTPAPATTSGGLSGADTACQI